jgi:predicted enzyme related to lactoylglutathione lyase
MNKFDNFFFPSDHLEESKKFYSETLGLETKFDFSNNGMIAFKVGNEEPAIIIKDRSKFPLAQPTLWIEVNDVKIMHTELKQKGVQFLSEPFKIRTGWAVEFTDPSGNILGITDYNN